MRTIWIGFAAMALALCGCLQKARTPFNEVSLFRNGSAGELEAPSPVVNYWPLYLSDGRASYWLWPFVKASPGCFAIQPVYNHDHGIHDFCWFVTLSPKSGEYRVWPVFYRCPSWWLFLPFAYASEGTDHESAGSPLLFNWGRDWHCTASRTGDKTRFAPRSERWNLGLVLWGMEKTYPLPKGALPADLLNEVPRHGAKWSVLLGALGAERSVSVRHPWEWQSWREHAFGWLLWRWKENFDYDAGPSKLSRSYFTPLYAYNFTQDLRTGKTDFSRHGLALHAVSWRFKDDAYAGSSLLWRMLFADSISRYRYGKDNDSYQRSSNVLLGALYDRDRTIEDRVTQNCKKPFDKSRRVVDNVDTDSLFGLLYSHERTDVRRWEWPADSQRPEAPEYDFYEEKLSVLTPLVYRYEGQRDGSFGSRSLFGLLYDHTLKTRNDTETLGILGYLYRYNRYADGTVTRAAFPFINVTTHKDSGDWSFSFLHKLFRIERTKEGLDWWLFWL